MADDTQQRLERWWGGLSDEQRAELLPLSEGDPLPSEHVLGLADALGGPLGAALENEERFQFTVDDRVGAFLDAKRSQAEAR
jgi:hypothetical protein